MADLSDEAKEVLRILKEDGVHIHKTYAAFLKSQKEAETTDPPTDPPTEGGPPPVKDKPIKEDPPVKQGIWWKGRTSD